MKKRIVGSANPNSIGPRGKTVTQDYGVAKDKSLSTSTRGVGPVIADIALDEATNTLEIIRTSNESSHNPIALKRGVIMHEAFSISLAKGSKLSGPENWFPTTGVGNAKAIDPLLSPILPDTFTHSDGFGSDQAWVSNLPVGMAWVRLSPHSPSVGHASWDADEDDHTINAESQDGRGPVLSFATIDAGSRTVTLWFDQPLNSDLTYYYKQRTKISIKSNKARIKIEGSSLEQHPSSVNALIFTIDRVVSVDEDIYIRAFTNLTKNTKSVPNRSSPPVSATITSDKNCYVLAVLTASPSETSVTLLAKDTVLFGTPTNVLDVRGDVEKDQVSYVVHAISPAGAPSGGSGESYGVIWGGSFGNVTYGRLQIRYRNHTQWSLKGFQPVTVVTDWSALELPSTWTPADELPTQTPQGIGYVRLLPFANSIGGSDWEDEGFTGRSDPIDAAPSILGVKVEGLVNLYITWDQPITIIGTDPLITATGGAVLASTPNVDYDNIISYTLDRPIQADEEISLTSLAEWVEAAHDSQYKSGALTIEVKNVNVLNSMVIVAHRIMPTTLYRGQVVRLKDNGFTVVDSNGVSKNVIDIMPSTDIMPEHHHSGDQDGGHAISHGWSGG